MIILFGDSHTASFVIENNIQYMIPDEVLIKNKCFNSFRTWPYTCYNINNKKQIIFDFLKKLNLTSKDIVFFSFGETDIRCHIGFNSKNEIEQYNLIQTIINNYITLLIEIKDIFKFNVGCYAPIASGIYNGSNGNAGIPSYSNCTERNKITFKFNNILKEMCEKNNITYKDIFRHLINEKMETKHELYCDKIHLGVQTQPLLLEEFSDIIKLYAN